MLSCIVHRGSVSERERRHIGPWDRQAAGSPCRARGRLERNALWQALIASADRPTREQCERGLAGNPLYRSLCAVNAAIESLRSGNGAITPPDHEVAGQAGPLRQREIELADILQAIRVYASAGGDRQPLAIAVDEALATQDAPAAVELAQPPLAVEAQPEPPPSASMSAVEPAPAPAADAGAAVALAAEQRPRIPTVAASSHVNTDAAERAKRLEEERRKLRNSDELGFDTEEATVSFIIRQRKCTAAASATATATTVPAQPRQAAHAARGNEGYVPHNSRAEEAEVVVIKPSNGRAHIVESHLFKRGPVRRFLRSLTRS